MSNARNVVGQRNSARKTANAPRKRAKRQKMEFSKKLLIASFTFVVIITIFSMAMVIITGDVSSLEFLIVSAFAELATASGFYYSKAKAENRIKLRKQYGADIYNDSGASDA